MELFIIIGLTAGLLLAVSRLRELKEQRVEAVGIARRDAGKIVKDAENRAEKIVGSAEITADKIQKEWDRKLEGAMAERLREYERVLQGVSRSVEKSATQEIKEFRQAMQLETVGARKAVTEEIRRARADKLERLDLEIGQVIERVTREVLGKALSLAEHRELVIKALEEAKAQHVF